MLSMKSWLKENKLIVILLVVILGLAFYWYEWRPAQIKGKCSQRATEGVNITLRGPVGFLEKLHPCLRKSYDQCYEICLQEKGLEK